MKSIKYLNTFDEVKSLVDNVQKRRILGSIGLEPRIQEYYRGQTSDTFMLKPGLARYYSDIKTLLNVESKLIADFKAEIFLNKKDEKILLIDNPKDFQNEWAWLCQAQHYGLPTRILDWSLSWQVALFFAVENNPNFNSHDAQFWVVTVPDKMARNDTHRILYFESNPYQQEETIFLNPSFYWTVNYNNEIAEIKRARQHGKFSIQSHTNLLTPLEQQEELIPHLEKYCIPADAKGQIRLELAAQGIHKNFLYADEDQELKEIIFNLKRKYNFFS